MIMIFMHVDAPICIFMGFYESLVDDYEYAYMMYMTYVCMNI